MALKLLEKYMFVNGQIFFAPKRTNFSHFLKVLRYELAEKMRID